MSAAAAAGRADPGCAARTEERSAGLSVLHVDLGGEWGGGQSQARHLMQGLRDRGGTTQALVTARGSRLATQAGALGIRVRTVPFRYAIDVRAVSALVDELRVAWSVVHVHDSAGLQNAAAALAISGSTASLVATRNVMHPPRTPGVWRRARLVIAVSGAVREVLVGRGIEESRVRVVHAGIPLPADGDSRRTGRLRGAAAVSGRHLLVGVVGALSPEKGIDLFVRAAGALTRHHPDARFAVYGDGPERGRLERLVAASGLDDRVTLAGWIADAAASMGDLDLFVMPSRREGFGTACLEAMAAGVPVVFTSAGGLAELAGSDLPTVAPGDPSALAAAMHPLLGDAGARARRAEAGRRRAACFDAGRMVAGTLRCYREALRP